MHRRSVPASTICCCRVATKPAGTPEILGSACTSLLFALNLARLVHAFRPRLSKGREGGCAGYRRGHLLRRPWRKNSLRLTQNPSAFLRHVAWAKKIRLYNSASEGRLEPVVCYFLPNVGGAPRPWLRKAGERGVNAFWLAKPDLDDGGRPRSVSARSGPYRFPPRATRRRDAAPVQRGGDLPK